MQLTAHDHDVIQVAASRAEIYLVASTTKPSQLGAHQSRRYFDVGMPREAERLIRELQLNTALGRQLQGLCILVRCRYPSKFPY